MTVKRIYAKNAAYQRFEVLKTNRNKRHRYGEFFVEGVRNINEALRGGWRFSALLYDAQARLSAWARGVLDSARADVHFALSPPLMRELSGKDDTSELLAVVRMRTDGFDALPLGENPLIMLFDRPSNRGNLGTLIRSCDALGADCVLVTGHAVDIYDPEVIAAGMGSFFRVPAFHIADNERIAGILAALRARFPGFLSIATTAHRQKPLFEAALWGPCMLLIGNETDGLCRALYDMADDTVTIPMAQAASASSLNVACAATVLLYEVNRQRGHQAK